MHTDELLFRIGRALERGALDAWESAFAKSVIGRASRVGQAWEPTRKQRRAIERIIADAEAPEVIEAE